MQVQPHVVVVQVRHEAVHFRAAPQAGAVSKSSGMAAAGSFTAAAAHLFWSILGLIATKAH